MKRIVERRKALGWTQNDLARNAGLSQSHIAHFEAGRRSPNLANLIRLADTLSVTLDWLVGRDDWTLMDRAYRRGREDELAAIRRLLL